MPPAANSAHFTVMPQTSLPPLRPYIEGYLRERPLFFTLIRAQEAALFKSAEDLLAHPILDFGCGDGFFARLVFGQGLIDVGLDLEASRISEARATGVYGEVVSYDGDRIPFPDGHFGSVISNCVMEHVTGIEHAVHEINRVTRSEGHLITSVMTERWEEYMLGARLLGDRYRSFMRRQQEHQNLLSVEGWEAMFQDAGFEVVRAVGYLSPRTSLYLDASHYLSVTSLAARALTGQWVFLPDAWARLAPLLERGIDLPVPAEGSAAVFFVLRKAAA